VNLASIIEPHADDAVALISRGRRTTYGELRRQIGALRGGLVGLGLEPGDRVGIAASNNWYFVVSYFATLGAGLVAVPLNPLSPPAELGKELAVIGARALFIGPTARSRVAGLDRSALPSLEHVIASNGTEFAGGIGLDELMTAEAVPIVERGDDDHAVFVFTSGTAGSPKAAMLSHGNLLANIGQILDADPEPQSPGDVSLDVLPLFHIYGLNVVLNVALSVGSTVLLIERFDPISALEAIKRHGVTIVAGAPTMFAAWAALPEVERDAMATVRLATSGASRLARYTVEQMQARFGITLSEGYGLTEASPAVTSSTGLEPRVGSIGAPLPGVDVRLVDIDGDDVLVGDSGELLVRGPNVFLGYWGDEDATSAVIDEDGWLHTGDIAVVDDDGYLYLVDRIKDLIIVSGFNVYPAEVEEVLMLHPAIKACAVIGVSHPHSGEAVKAYVVAEEGRSIEEEDVIAFCADHLARYKCPEKVMFVDSLPENVSGKVLRRSLR
jgi:long-chain acyl-CoA synthetase